MAYAVVAFPELPDACFSRIQAYRKANDRLYRLIQPHFTFIFPVDGFKNDELINHVTGIINDYTAVEFDINEAIVHKDEISGCYMQFLVPGKGRNEMTALHDNLYTAGLQPFLRLDTSYLPHITIGQCDNLAAAKLLTDGWNSEATSFPGSISRISLLNYENNQIEIISNFDFAGHQKIRV